MVTKNERRADTTGCFYTQAEIEAAVPEATWALQKAKIESRLEAVLDPHRGIRALQQFSRDMEIRAAQQARGESPGASTPPVSTDYRRILGRWRHQDLSPEEREVLAHLNALKARGRLSGLFVSDYSHEEIAAEIVRLLPARAPEKPSEAEAPQKLSEEESPQKPTTPEIAPRFVLAAASLERIGRQAPDLIPEGRATTMADRVRQHEFLTDHGYRPDGDGSPPPLHTWVRYVREYERLRGGPTNTPRGGRICLSAILPDGRRADGDAF